MKVKIFLLSGFALLMVGCSTFTASDVPLSSSTYYLEMMGNGVASVEKLENDFKRRASQLCGSDQYFSKFEPVRRVPNAVLPGIAMCKKPGWCPGEEASWMVVVGIVSCENKPNIGERVQKSEAVFEVVDEVAVVREKVTLGLQQCFASSPLPYSRSVRVGGGAENEISLSKRIGFSKYELLDVYLATSESGGTQVRLVQPKGQAVGNWLAVAELIKHWLAKESLDCWVPGAEI